MIAGALNFTLGLQANQFLNTLGASSGKLLGFLGVANTVGAAFNKLWGAVEKGGALKDLAASASLTVKDLYQLQRGFKEVGASADAVPSVINRLRRTLAGGGEANNVLQSLGLDPETIARMNPAQQFEKIATAMAKVNVNARSQAATALFGREGASVIQQIANSGNDFASAMQRASKDAGIWQNVSGAFDAISDKVAEVQAHIETMWATLAGALIQAFNEGHLAETVFDIFATAFNAIGVALPNLLQGGLVKIGESLFRVLETPLIYLQSLLDASVEGWMALFAKIPGLRDALGIPADFKPSSFDDIVANNKKNGLDFFGANTGDMAAFSNDQFKAAFDAAAPLFEALGVRLEDLVAKLPQGSTLAAGVGGGGITSNKNTRSDFTSIEKMGGVFLGMGRGFGGDEARRTADNTKRTADLLLETNTLLQTQKTNFANV